MYQTIGTYPRTTSRIENPNIAPARHLSSTEIVSRIPLPPPIKTWWRLVEQGFRREGISIVEILNGLTNLGWAGFHNSIAA